MKKNLKLYLFIFTLVLFTRCNKSEDESILGSNNLIFIEHFEIIDGVLISGKEPPLLCIDFPTYSFNSETKILEGSINFDLNNSLELIFGSGAGLTGTAGSGSASGLFPVNNFPYEHGKIKVLEYDAFGTTSIVIYNDTLSLKWGEFWKTETSYPDTMIFDGQTTITQKTYTETVKNHGILHKKDIIKWNY